MLEWKNLCFSYGEREVLHDLSDTVADGEILAVMGPSGCGKSTLLSLCAGLLTPTGGSLRCNAKRRSMVFQEPRLFPWYNVMDNLRAVLPRDIPEEQIQQALASVELNDSSHLFPAALSGGMKSRVAIARAIAYDGDLFLLDEPFAALDEDLRVRIATRLRAHLKARNATALLVTHLQSDAQLLADRIIDLPMHS